MIDSQTIKGSLMMFNEVRVDVGAPLELRIPLPTKLGSIPEIFSLSECVGIAPPNVNIISLSLDDIIHILNILVTNGFLDNKISKVK